MVNQICLNDKYIISIKEDDGSYVYYHMKYGENIYYALNILVYKNLGHCKKGDCLGKYSNHWKEKVNASDINDFIRKILENSEFRKGYLCDGTGFDDIFLYNNESTINKKCKEDVENFYLKRKSQRTDDSYRKLRTYGRDIFSKLKLNELKELLASKDVELAKLTFCDEKSIMSTLRWCCRGLLIDDAIKKVKIDSEKHLTRFNN